DGENSPRRNPNPHQRCSSPATGAVARPLISSFMKEGTRPPPSALPQPLASALAAAIGVADFRRHALIDFGPWNAQTTPGLIQRLRQQGLVILPRKPGRPTTIAPRLKHRSCTRIAGARACELHRNRRRDQAKP